MSSFSVHTPLEIGGMLPSIIMAVHLVSLVPLWSLASNCVKHVKQFLVDSCSLSHLWYT